VDSWRNRSKTSRARLLSGTLWVLPFFAYAAVTVTRPLARSPSDQQSGKASDLIRNPVLIPKWQGKALICVFEQPSLCSWF
jgi:hypothetical protein